MMIEVYGKYRRERFPRWLLFLLIGISVLIVTAGAVIWYVYSANEYRVDLTLIGDEQITLEYGEPYQEPGAEAFGYGTLLKREPIARPVTITGTVDDQKLGTYTLNYRSGFEDATASASRSVTVIDSCAPVITLKTVPDYYTLPGQPYHEEGYEAVDNYDGDLTDRVLAKEENGQMIYTVTDSSGNQAQTVRTIIYNDPIPPELTLKGEPQITITEGESWTDPGFTAVDNVDGDITAKVVVTGQVNVNQPGAYQLVYQVTDAYENAARTERVVTVKAKPAPAEDPNAKVIYLTFDDGPGPHTPRLLEVLKKHNVKATFFVCNTDYVHLLSDIAKDGHTVAIHTYTHNYSQIYASEEAFYQDLYAMQDVICSYTGINPVIMRFPGGTSNTVSRKYCRGIMTQLTKSVKEKGFYYFDWNVDSDDAGSTKTKEGVLENVISGIAGSPRKNHYVLQHDIYGFSVDAVEEIILWGLEHGYIFKAITPDSPMCHHYTQN